MNEEAADHPGELKEPLNDQPGSPDISEWRDHRRFAANGKLGFLPLSWCFPFGFDLFSM